ncbi:unnamed protein product, partial [marine sediment metagenome]
GSVNTYSYNKGSYLDFLILKELKLFIYFR